MSDQVLQTPTAAAAVSQKAVQADYRDPDGQLVASTQPPAPGQCYALEEADILNSLFGEWRAELPEAALMGTLGEFIVADCSTEKTAKTVPIEQASQPPCTPQHAANLTVATGLPGSVLHPSIQAHHTQDALGSGAPAKPLDSNKPMLLQAADHLHTPTLDVPAMPDMQPYLVQPHPLVGGPVQQTMSGNVQRNSLMEYTQAQAAASSGGVHVPANSFGWGSDRQAPGFNRSSFGAPLGPGMQQDIAQLPGLIPAAQPLFSTAFNTLANAAVNPWATAALNPITHAALSMATAALNPMARWSQILAQGLTQQQLSLMPGRATTLPSSRDAAAAAVQPHCASTEVFGPTATAGVPAGMQQPYPIPPAVTLSMPPGLVPGQQMMATPESLQQQQQFAAATGQLSAQPAPRQAYLPLALSAATNSSCEVPLVPLPCSIVQGSSADQGASTLVSGGLFVQDGPTKVAPAATHAASGPLLHGLPPVPPHLIASLSGLPFLQGAPVNNPGAAAAAAAAADAALAMLPGSWPLHLPGLLRPPPVPAPNLSQLALVMQAAVQAAAAPGGGWQQAAMLAAAMQSLAASSMPGMFGPTWTGASPWQQQQQPPQQQQQAMLGMPNTGSCMAPLGLGYLPPQIAGGTNCLEDAKVTVLSSSHPHAGSHYQTSTTGDHSGRACDGRRSQSQQAAAAQRIMACENPGPSLALPQQQLQQQWPLQETCAGMAGCTTAIEGASEGAELNGSCLHNSSRSQQGMTKRKAGDGRRTRAHNRPRVKGRFVKISTPGAAAAGSSLDGTEQQHTTSDHDASEGETEEEHHARTSCTQAPLNAASWDTAGPGQACKQDPDLKETGEMPPAQQQLAVSDGAIFQGGAAHTAICAATTVQLFSPDNAASSWACMSHVPGSSRAAYHAQHVALQQPLSACAGFVSSVSTFAGACPARYVQQQQQQWAAGVSGQCDWPVPTAGLTSPATTQRVERVYSSKRSWVMEHLDGPAKSDPSTTVCDSGTAGQLPDCGVSAAQQSQRLRRRSCSSLPSAAEPSASDGSGFPGLFSAPIGCLAATAGGSSGAAGAERGMHTCLHLCDSNRLTSTQQQPAACQAYSKQLPPLSSGMRNSTAAFHSDLQDLSTAAATATVAPVSLCDTLGTAQAPVCSSAPGVEDTQHPRPPSSSTAAGSCSQSLAPSRDMGWAAYGDKRQKLTGNGDGCPAHAPLVTTIPSPPGCDAALPASTLTTQVHNQLATAAALSAPLLRVASAPLNRSAAAAQMPPPAAHHRPHSASCAAAAFGFAAAPVAPSNSSHAPAANTHLSPAVVPCNGHGAMSFKHTEAGVDIAAPVPTTTTAAAAAAIGPPQEHMHALSVSMLWQQAQQQTCVLQGRPQPQHTTQPPLAGPAVAASAGCGLQLAGLVAPQPGYMWPLAPLLKPWVNPSLAAAVAAAAAANRPLAAAGAAPPGMLPTAAMPGSAFLAPFAAPNPTSSHPSMLVAAGAFNDVGGAVFRQGRAADVRYGAAGAGAVGQSGAIWKQQPEGSEQADSCLP